MAPAVTPNVDNVCPPCEKVVVNGHFLSAARVTLMFSSCVRSLMFSARFRRSTPSLLPRRVAAAAETTRQRLCSLRYGRVWVDPHAIALGYRSLNE